MMVRSGFPTNRVEANLAGMTNAEKDLVARRSQTLELEGRLYI